MHILVFGGIGFIGMNVCREALRRGHAVTAFDNLSRPGVDRNLPHIQREKRFNFIKGDIRIKQDLKLLPNSIDCIINLAAKTSVIQSIRRPLYDFFVNVLGHLNILEYAKTHGHMPVILASSNKVYTNELNRYQMKEKALRYEYKDPIIAKYGLSEQAHVDSAEGFTNTPYGVGKLCAEKYTREYWKHYGIPMVINRMSCIYGEFQKGTQEQGWVDWFLRAKRLGKKVTIFGNGKQVRDLLFGHDVASLYLKQVEHIDRYSGMTFNIGGGSAKGYNTSLLELIALINDLFPGKKLTYRYTDWRPSDQRIYISDIRLVTQKIKWRPSVPVIDGLRIMWDAYDAL